MTGRQAPPRSPSDAGETVVGQAVGQRQSDAADAIVNPAADRLSRRPSDPPNLPATSPLPDADAAPIKRKPSLTRAASNRRTRLVQEALKGNHRALRHGAFARVAALPDVELECALVFASRPALDLVRDQRLVWQLATDRVMFARAVLAVEEHGHLPALVAAVRDHGNRAERLERAVFEREQARIRDTRAPLVDLQSKYREPDR